MDPAYPYFVQLTVTEGSQIDSRYGPTYERQNVAVSARPGEYPLRPGLNSKIGILEGLFMVGGFFDLDAIKRVAPNADHSLFTKNGAYGPRVGNQLSRLIDNLIEVPESRQHVLYVARPGDQYRVDTPCTTSLQFLVRDGKLFLTASMRSSDIIKGLPTDLLQFGILQQVVAGIVGLDLGRLTVFAASSHVYESDLEKAPTDARTRMVKVPVLGSLAEAQRWAINHARSTPWERLPVLVE